MPITLIDPSAERVAAVHQLLSESAPQLGRAAHAPGLDQRIAVPTQEGELLDRPPQRRNRQQEDEHAGRPGARKRAGLL